MARKKKQDITFEQVLTKDGFVNPATHTGQFAGNLASYGEYTFYMITRNRLELEAAYRGSWVVGRIVDSKAEDMTREGVKFIGLDPLEQDEFESELNRLNIWCSMCTLIKWGRLYGGAIAIFLIDGEDPETPLDINTIRPNSFKGLYICDRWMCAPSETEFVKKFGTDCGEPVYYEILETTPVYSGKKVHYTRVIKMVGEELPFYQRQSERWWGLSVVERIFDVLRAFDCATVGTSQLVYQSRLRVLKIKNYRNAMASTNEAAKRGLTAQLDNIRIWQNNEGMTVIDAEDEFDQQTYSFSGLDEVLQQFAGQISGSCEIPITRLMGQSPKGFSSGDMEMHQYYESIKQKQESLLREGLTRLFSVIYKSLFYKSVSKDFNFRFNSLWTPNDREQAEIMQMRTDTVLRAFESGLITSNMALQELKDAGWESIKPEDIDKTSDVPEVDENEPESSFNGATDGGSDQQRVGVKQPINH